MTTPIVIPITGTVDPALLAGIGTLVTNLNAAATAQRAAAKEAKDSEISWSNMGRSLGNFATNANQVLQFGQTVLRVAGATADLVAEQQRLDQMSARLGLNFDQAAAAAGRFTDEVDVMNTAGQFAARGIHLTQTELDALTHTSAIYAQRTGVETSAALETLTGALIRGRARGLLPFGQSLADAAAHGYTMREGLAAVVVEAGRTAAATEDAHTSMAGLSDSLGDAARGFAAMAANGLGLDGVVAGISRRVGQLAADLHVLNDPTNTPEGRSQVDDRNHALSEYTEARAALAAQLRRGNGDLSLLPGIDVGNQTSGQLRNQAHALATIAGRAGGPSADGGGILIGGVDPLATPIDLDTAGAERELRALRDQITEERAGLARAAETPGDAAARGRQITRDTGAGAAAAAARREQAAEEIIRTEAAATTIEAIEEKHRRALAAIQQVGNREHRALLAQHEVDAYASAQGEVAFQADQFTALFQREQAERERDHAKAMEEIRANKHDEDVARGTAERGETFARGGADRALLFARSQAANDNDRPTNAFGLSTENTRASLAHAEAEATNALAFANRELAAAQAEVLASGDASIEQRQRITAATAAVASATNDSAAAHRAANAEVEKIKTDRTDALAESAHNLAGGLVQTGVAALIAGQNVGEAMRAQLAASLATLAAEAAQRALFAAATGVFQLATYQYPAAAQSFLSAGMFAAVAVGAGVASSVIAPGNPSKAQGAGGGAGNGGTSGLLNDKPAKGGSEGTVINVTFGGPMYGTGGVRQASREIANLLNDGARQGGVTLSPVLMAGGGRG